MRIARESWAAKNAGQQAKRRYEIPTSRQRKIIARKNVMFDQPQSGARENHALEQVEMNGGDVFGGKFVHRANFAH